MAVLACDVCGGKLVMGAGGVAVCDSCGMEHSKDRMQEKVQEIKGTVQVSNIAGIESLMKRGRLALEDSDWEQANDYFGKVLDIDAEYAPAYVGKLCANISRIRHGWQENNLFVYTIKKEADLARYYKPLDDEPDYQKAIRFADEAYRAQLEGYNSEIKKRIEELKKEFAFYMVIVKYDNFCECKKDDAFGIARWKQTGRYICEITKSECHVGRLERGVKFKILRTGKHYEVDSYESELGRYRTGVLLSGERIFINEGDVAVFTHEMRRLEEEKKELARIEQQRCKEQERIEKQRREEEEQRRKEEEQRRIEQSKQWEKQGLCRYCGGTLGFLKKCKSCGKKN